jgi:uncharacterized protein (TIRG00374 family)
VNRRVGLRALAGIAVSIIAVVLVAQTADVPAALAQVATVDPRALLLPTVVILVQLLVRAVRWSGILSAMAGEPIGTRQVVGPLAVGYLGNIVLPARLGEVGRLVVVSRRTGASATASTASVVVERAVDLLALLSIVAAASAVVGATGWLPVAVVIVLVLGLVVAMRTGSWLANHVPTRVPPRIREIAIRLFAALAAARPRVVGRAFALSLVAWSLDALTIWLCASALGIQIPLGIAALIASGAAVGTALPAAAGYVGTYELGAMTMATLAGVPPEVALQIVLLGHAMAVVPLAVTGLVALAAMALTPVRRPEPATGHARVIA